MKFETKQYSFEIPEKWKDIVGAEEKENGVILKLLREDNPSHDGILVTLKTVKDKKSITGEFEQVGKLISNTGEVDYLFAIFGHEGACSEENEELFFRILDQLFKVYQTIQPANGYSWEALSNA